MSLAASEAGSGMDTEAAPPPRPPATGTSTGDQPCAPPVPAPVTTARGNNTGTPPPSTVEGTGANDDDAPAPAPGHDTMADDDGTGDASTENAAEATMMQHFECVPCACVPVPTPRHCDRNTLTRPHRTPVFPIYACLLPVTGTSAARGRWASTTQKARSSRRRRNS